MLKMNPDLFRQLLDFIDSLRSMKKDKALEVACGAGYVTKNVLHHYFNEIDMYDRHPDSVKAAQKLVKGLPKVNPVT